MNFLGQHVGGCSEVGAEPGIRGACLSLVWELQKLLPERRLSQERHLSATVPCSELKPPPSPPREADYVSLASNLFLDGLESRSASAILFTTGKHHHQLEV